MAGNFPFIVDALKKIRIQKTDGTGIDILPWNNPSLSPLVSLSIDENIFNPLMSGTIILKDIGDWSNEMQLNAFDEIHIKFNAQTRAIELSGQSKSIIKSYDLVFEIVNIKTTVDNANKAYQNSLEKARMLTIEFVSKNIITKEFLSSLLEDENFIGPIFNDGIEQFTLSGDEGGEIQLKGFNDYLKKKLNITLDGDRTWNHCYLKKNNVSYPWGKLRGQPTILQTLQYLAENAVEFDNNTAVNYLFWQDLDGFHFKSINTLIRDNIETSGDLQFDFSDMDLKSNSIRNFTTLTEFDALNMLNADTYFSWYERIIPDYTDPYLDFVDSSDGLTRENIYYDINQEYGYINHIENGKLFQSGLTSTLDPKNSKFPQSNRKDDDVYGFFSKNRYNNPNSQEWDYLGTTGDTRLSNVVWQNQFDLDDEVYPEILYVYDKLIRKNIVKNREKYVKLKNAKRKWEVYRCSVCCTTQQGGTADMAILNGLTGGTGDYVYYFGPTGIFGDLATEGYGIVAAGAFSDVVNYMPGVTGVTSNGLTLSYNMQLDPYNKNIGQFYHLKQQLDDVSNQIDRTIQEYQDDLLNINIYINRIETQFLPNVDGWILAATDYAYSNLTPGFIKTCSDPIDNTGSNGPGTGILCCNEYNNYDCFSFGVVDYYPPEDTQLNYYRSQINGTDLIFDFGLAPCKVKKLPLYVNLQFDKSDISSFPVNFSGYWDKFIAYSYNDKTYPWYVTPAAKQVWELLNCQKLVDGKMAYELEFEQPNFLYQCSKTKLLTGIYYRTFEDPNFIKGDFNQINVTDESAWLDTSLSDGVSNDTIWCDTCLDPIALRGAKFEYTKILKQFKLRRFVLDNLIAKLQAVKTSYEQKYTEFLSRKAFFISKNPFDPGVTGNILNKKSPLNLFNVKSIKRKPIRGSRYEILAKRLGVTSGVGNYVYDIFFGDDSSRNPGITGNHPYYDQKYKTFKSTETSFSKNYATKDGFDSEKRDFADSYYYDNNLGFLIGSPGLTQGSLPKGIGASLILPGNVYTNNNLSYPTSFTIGQTGSISSYLKTPLNKLTQKYNVFTTEDGKKPPSILKEEIASYVRIEFKTPIGLDRIVDFPTGFVRDAGSEYFLPYLVQLTAGPNGRQTIQNNVVVIGMDPYGFDVAIKKNKIKNEYSDFKEWGNYWWHTPVNKLRLQQKMRDVPEMGLWAEKTFENEFTYYENNGYYIHDIGDDFTEYDNYQGAASGIFNKNAYNSGNGAFYVDYQLSGYYNRLNSALQNIISPTDYHISIPGGIYEHIQIPKPSLSKSIAAAKFGSYNLIGSHLHYNSRRSWYDFTFPSKLYFDTLFKKIANVNNLRPGLNVPIFDVKTILTSDDFVAFGGNDFIFALDNSIALKNTDALKSFIQSNSIDNVIIDNQDIAGDSILSQFSGITLSSQNALPKIFTDDIEAYLNSDLALYKPGLLTTQVWKYDIFGETEYGITTPPTLPPEYDIFDNNFAAQFVVFSQTNSESNICKKLKLKCLNPKGPVSNDDCPIDDPYCHCPAKNLIPKEQEPSYKELAIAFEETKECKLIEKYLGKDYLGCILSDDLNVASCNCPEQGKYFSTFLNTIRSNATFYVTPPETPLRRQAQMMMFNAQRAIMNIFPNDELKIGSIITVKKPNPSLAYNNRYDRISGKWMVTGISRIFKSSNIESMLVTLNRDSYYQENKESITPVTYKKDIF